MYKPYLLGFNIQVQKDVIIIMPIYDVLTEMGVLEGTE